jgi:hypothetical protein
MDSSSVIQNLCKNSLVTPTQSLHAATSTNSFWDGNCGVDTVRIGFTLNPDLLSLHEPVWESHSHVDQKADKEFEWFTHNIWIGFTNVHITVRPTFNNCSLEFNAPQVLRNKSLFLLEPEALVGVVEKVLDGVRDLLSGAFDQLNPNTGEITRHPNWCSMVRFERLDLAKNFYIPSLADLANVKAAITKTIPKNMKKKGIFESPKYGWTVENKTNGVGMDRIYDKSVELARHHGSEKAPSGSLRFETQLQGNRLKAPIFVKTLDSLTNTVALEALEARWKACKWGVPVMEANSIYKAVESLSETKQERMLGFMMKAADGQTSAMDPRHLHAMTKEARLLGLVPGMPVSAQGKVSKMLDLRTGGLVEIR